MKILRLILINLIFINTAHASVCTDYLSEIYSSQHGKKIEITQKNNEHTDKLEDRIGNRFVSSVVYGKARIRGLGKRQKTLNYACLMENDKKPLWGYIFSD